MQVFYRKPISFIFIAVIVSMSFVCRQLYIGTSCVSKDCEGSLQCQVIIDHPLVCLIHKSYIWRIILS